MSSTKIEVCSSDVVRLMTDLRDWQKLLVHLECVLTWERPLVLFYIICFITAFYVVLWTYEPPVLVSIGCLSIFFSLWCFFGPMLALRLLPEVPLSEHNSRYRSFCRRILNARQMFISVFQHISDLRQRRPYVYAFVALCTIVNLEVLTYNYDGILIAYVLTLVALLTPGIRHTGVLRTIYLLVKKSVRFVFRIVSKVIVFVYWWLPSSFRSCVSEGTGTESVKSD